MRDNRASRKAHLTTMEVCVRRTNLTSVALLLLTACAGEGAVQPTAARPHAVNISATVLTKEHDSVTVFGVRGKGDVTLSTVADSAAWVSALRAAYVSKDQQLGNVEQDEKGRKAANEIALRLSKVKDIRELHEFLKARNGAVERREQTLLNGARIVQFAVGGNPAVRFANVSRTSGLSASRVPLPSGVSAFVADVDCSLDPTNADCADPSAAVADGISLAASVDASLSDAGALFSSASSDARGACDGAMNQVLGTGGVLIGTIIGAEVAADLGAIPAAWWLVKRVPAAGFAFWLTYQNLQDCLHANGGTPAQYPKK